MCLTYYQKLWKWRLKHGSSSPISRLWCFCILKAGGFLFIAFELLFLCCLGIFSSSVCSVCSPWLLKENCTVVFIFSSFPFLFVVGFCCCCCYSLFVCLFFVGFVSSHLMYLVHCCTSGRCSSSWFSLFFFFNQARAHMMFLQFCVWCHWNSIFSIKKKDFLNVPTCFWHKFNTLDITFIIATGCNGL